MGLFIFDIEMNLVLLQSQLVLVLGLISLVLILIEYQNPVVDS